MEKKDMKLMDALKQAIEENNMESIKAILKKNPELVFARTRSGGTLLHDAAQYGTIESVKFFIERGIDVTLESPASGNCGTALTCANSPEIAQKLMQCGLKPNLEMDNKRNPLFFHICYGNEEMVRYWFYYEMELLDNEQKKILEKKVVKELDWRRRENIILNLGLNSEKILGGACADELSLSTYKENLINTIKYVFHKIQDEHKNEHIYAFTIANTPTFDELFFIANTKEYLAEEEADLEVKYFEENWSIWEADNEIYQPLNKTIFDFAGKINQYKERIKLNNKLFNLYLECMKELRNAGFFGDILLNVYVREYLSDEAMVAIYQELNTSEEVKEYSKLMLG